MRGCVRAKCLPGEWSRAGCRAGRETDDSTVGRSTLLLAPRWLDAFCTQRTPAARTVSPARREQAAGVTGEFTASHPTYRHSSHGYKKEIHSLAALSDSLREGSVGAGEGLGAGWASSTYRCLDMRRLSATGAPLHLRVQQICPKGLVARSSLSAF